jgi:hypothetical protein
MKLFKSVEVNNQVVHVYVTNYGQFVAYEREQSPDNPDPNEIIHSADTYSILMERVEKRVKRASRIKIAVPFSRLEVPNPHVLRQPVEFEFHEYIVTGKHRGTGNWLVYDVRRDRTSQESINYGSFYPPADEIPQLEKDKYAKLLEAQAKVNNMLKAWHERNQIHLIALANSALREAQSRRIDIRKDVDPL